MQSLNWVRLPMSAAKGCVAAFRPERWWVGEVERKRAMVRL